MSLKNNNYSSLYRKKDDVLNNFYIPSLANSNVYKRVSAYFSSDVLKLYSKGLSSFVRSNGKILFIFSHHITKEDYDQIIAGYDGRFDEELKNKLTDLEDDCNISNLAYLISIGVIEIKIGFVTPGTLHFKFGLFEDGEDIVCFRGSTNETTAGLLLNGENFEVSCSWLCSEHEYGALKGYKQDFDDLWNNRYEGVKVIEAPKCVMDELQTFNKYNLINDYEDQCSNTFILDFDSKFNLIGYSFLNNKDLLAPSSLFFKTKISYAVDSIDNLSVYKFKELPPKEIKILIDSFKTYSEKQGFNFRTTQKVKDYISSLDLYLNERTSLGNAIKSKDEIVFDKFNEFTKVIDEELERKLAIPQLWDAFHAVNMVASCNFSVPGTGKTTIAYGAFGYLSSKANNNKIKRIVMIGPKNSFMAWKNEFVLCFGNKRSLKCFNVQDNEYKNNNQRIAGLIKNYENANLILINYDMLQNYDLREALAMLMRQNNFSDYLVLDEAHKIKGFEGKRANAVLKLAPFARHKLVLTGTPIPNSYLDIFNMLNILFGNDYENFFGFSPAYLSQASYIPSKQAVINKKIYPFFCRTTKKDLNIPNATFNYDDCKIIMDEKEEHLFKLVHDYFGYNTLVLYIRLLQASINPAAIESKLKKNDILEIFAGIDDGDKDPFSYGNEFTDFEFLNETLKTTEKNHNAVFSKEDVEFLKNFGLTRKFYSGIEKIEELIKKKEQVVAWGVFVNTLYCIHEELNKRGIKSIVICGSMPLVEREENIKKFISGEYDVLISNPHTLAESVSLHKNCHNAVYFEYTFNLTHMLQSRDRIHRLGLANDTATNYYFTSIDTDKTEINSVDLKTLERLQYKEERMLKAVESNQLFIKTESFKDDINFIFNLKTK